MRFCLVTNKGAARVIAWEVSATVLRVLGALVVDKRFKIKECILSPLGAARNIAYKTRRRYFSFFKSLLTLGSVYEFAIDLPS